MSYQRPAQAASVRTKLFLLFIVLALMLVNLSGSSADNVVSSESVSTGRPVTPAGSLVMDLTTRRPAVGALPVDFVRSPDHAGPDGGGRYLVAVNSGYGVQFKADVIPPQPHTPNPAQQSLAIIDLNTRPAPAVIQNVYFPTPQSVNVGVCFSQKPDPDGSYTLYASGGFENKIWMFRFRPNAVSPITPASTGPDTKVEAPFIDVSGFASAAPTPRYNGNHVPVYPTGLAIGADDNTLFVANNLGDSLGVVSDPRGKRRLERIELVGQQGAARAGDADARTFIYPYAVVALASPRSKMAVESQGHGSTSKVYVSCWNDASVAVVDFAGGNQRVLYIPVERHPTAMVWNSAASRLYVVNSNADSVSVIDTTTDRVVERINVRLTETVPPGWSPESLALSADGLRLYVANSHSCSVAVIELAGGARGGHKRPGVRDPRRSVVRGFIPTGQYPSAIASVGRTLFVGNGKGTGFENSSLIVSNSGRAPNAPNDNFPRGTGNNDQGGQYSVSLVAGNISAIAEPDARALARFTQQVMRNNGLLGAERKRLFPGRSPIRHVIYVIKENRTYDQVFGDLESSGDGRKADGDPSLAIFGSGAAAQSQAGTAQKVTPNHRELARRFGLLDRFFVNAEASPDGHNWSTAAFSNDYVDKAYRWNYSGRGRTYDFEGFNRLPNFFPRDKSPSLFRNDVAAAEIAAYLSRFIPYLNGGRDVGEPETLYLWDAAARAGLSYRNYGEFIGTISDADVKSIKANKQKSYPDTTPTASAVPTKKSLEDHHSTTFRNYDADTPDAMTVDSYRAAKERDSQVDPLISSANPDERFRGNSRLGSWLEEFHGYVAALKNGRPDPMPNFSILRLPNDHTVGLKPDKPTPQFYVADNDYAIGRLVEAVSNSPYWRDTAIFIVEDDAQDGPDHVDAHRSVALVISAYNRPKALIHEFHNTVSLIRTMEMLLGIEPMNQLDATATPIDIFQSEPDLSPYKAKIPELAHDNLLTVPARDTATLYWMQRTAEQDMSHADLADSRALNEIIWFSVRGARVPMPEVVRLPLFDVMTVGIAEKEDDEREAE